jgi:ornithine carbamoyltransferase
MVLQEILKMNDHEEKRDLLAIDDFAKELPELIDWAIKMKNGEGIIDEFKPLEGMSIGSIYEKPSTRTRVSFEVGVSKLGGQPITLLSNDIQLGKSESIADTAAVLSRFLDGMTYRCFKHDDVRELAKYSSIPVINALSDLHHPCQAAADLMTITEHKEKVNGHISWVGDGNNVFHDLLLASVSMGHDVHYATPIGFEPDKTILERAVRISENTGAKIIGTNDPREAVADAGVIYTDIKIFFIFHEKTKRFTGVYFNKSTSKYKAQITHEKKSYYCGTFFNELKE